LTKELARFKLELLCNGLRLGNSIKDGKGRKSGAGPAGGRFLKLSDDIILNVPTWPKFAEKSSYFLEKSDIGYEIWKGDKKIREVELLPSEYEFYQKKTSTNIEMKKIALIHGEDCLATTVNQKCYYWREGLQCLFCGIEGSLKGKSTIALKKPIELYETAQAAIDEGVCEHFTLTTGTANPKDKGSVHMEKVVKKLEPLGKPIHVQFEPTDNFNWFDRIYAAGAKTIGLHVETLNKEKYEYFCPGKSHAANFNQFFDAWEYCVDLFGKNQVSTYYIIGLEKIGEELFKNIDKIASLKVIPFIVPVRPIAGAKIDSYRRPIVEELINIYTRAGKILHKYGLNPYKNKAGCVRCNACSAMKESYRYLS
jgi:radical SAM protein (TIGR04043 family)